MIVQNYTPLKDVCEFIVDCEHKTAPKQETGYPSIRTPNIGRGRLILDGVNRVSEETYAAWTRRAVPQADDLILAREAPAGNIAIVPKNLKVCLGQRTVLIRPDKSKIDPAYLLYFLLEGRNQAKLLSYGAGATVVHVNMADIRKFPLPQLPILPIQLKIASVLSTYDDLIENNTRRIKILEEMAQTIYREWFVNFHYPGHEKVKIVKSELGMIPEEWEVANLSEMTDFIRGTEPGSKNYLDGPDERTVPFLRVGDLGSRDSGIFIPLKLAKGKLLSKTDIAITLDGTVGIVRIGLFGAYSTGIRKVVIRDCERLSWAYLYFLLGSNYIQGIITAHAKGTTILHAGSSVQHMTFALPPIQLVCAFETQASTLLKSVLNLSEKNANLRKTRDLLLPKLISGQVDVSEMDIETRGIA